MYKILCIVFMIIPFCGIAQKVELKEDTIMVDNKTYAIMLSSGSKLNPNFTIQNMLGDDLIMIDMPATGAISSSNGNSSPYVFTFLGYEEYTARMMPTIPLKKTIAKNIVRYKLINQEGELDEKAIIRFCKVNFGDYTPLPNATENTEVSYVSGEYPIVERNTSEVITCASGNIRQDKKLVGKYKYETRSVKGIAENVVQFYSINNIKIAEARYTTGSSNCDLLVYKDNHKDRMELATPNKAVNEVVAYLVDMGYL